MENEVKINNVVVLEKLGTSSLGSTYKVKHTHYGICVLKVFDVKNKKFLSRFLSDLEKTKSFSHPKIAKIYEVSQEGDPVYVIREWVPGIELQQLIYQKQKLSMLEANSILLQATSGLDALHHFDVINKNLKPNNVIITAESQDVKLVDFSLPPTLAQYLSPEQCKGKKSGMHSDIYSLGCIYYYCLSGRTLFIGSKSSEIMEAHVTQPSPDAKKYRKNIPDDLLDILNQMISKKPEQRPLNCHELFLSLKEITKIKIENTRAIIKSDYEKPAPVTSKAETTETSTIQLIRVGNTWKMTDANEMPIVNQAPTNIEKKPDVAEKQAVKEELSVPFLESPGISNLPQIADLNLEPTDLNLEMGNELSYKTDFGSYQDDNEGDKFDSTTSNEIERAESTDITNFSEEINNNISSKTDFSIENPKTNNFNFGNSYSINFTNSEESKETGEVKGKEAADKQSFSKNIQNWLSEQSNLNTESVLDESSILDLYSSGEIDIPTDDVLFSEEASVPSAPENISTIDLDSQNTNFDKEETIDLHAAGAISPTVDEKTTDLSETSEFDNQKMVNLYEEAMSSYDEETAQEGFYFHNNNDKEKTVDLYEAISSYKNEEMAKDLYEEDDDYEQTPTKSQVSDHAAKKIPSEGENLVGEKTFYFHDDENKVDDSKSNVNLYETATIPVDTMKNNAQQYQKNVDIYSTQNISLYSTKKIDTSSLNNVDSLTKKHLRKFKEVTSKMAEKLKVVNQTLSMLDHSEDEGEDFLFLDEMLKFITRKTGEILGADYTIIFLYDEEQHELFSMEKDEDTPFDLKIPAETGIVGQVVKDEQFINISYDFYDDARSKDRKKIDEKKGYRTYTMLVLPILDKNNNLVAIVQLLNKLKNNVDEEVPLQDRIDKEGFSVEDIDLFYEFSTSMALILESSRSFYRATKRQRAAASLISATQTLGRSLDLKLTLSKVMEEAKGLLDADRITLWLLDKEKEELWANIETADGMREIRIPQDAGYAGQVVLSKEPLMIPFDIYEKENSETSKETDQKTGYRTCSMMCLPVFDKDQNLIGVTQAINKKRQGDYHPPYNPEDWPKAPELWRASFNKSDMEFLSVFNAQAGVAIQNAALFDTIKRQEQMQRDILRSLSNGVISVDKHGIINAANSSAVKILGFDKETDLYGKEISLVIKIKEGHFPQWLDSSLSAQNTQEQYYPEQIIVNGHEEHSVNLSINSIMDITNSSEVNGALVVIEDISHEKRMKNMMYRYMTQEVVEGLLTSGEIQLGGQRKHVTVLFSDIRSYTTLTEGLTAEEVVAMLNEYFEEMVDAIFKYKGTLDKYIGDAIMAVYGTPLHLEDHGWCAVQTALEMRQRLTKFNKSRQERGKQTLTIGIGIHSDEVVSGNIGSSKRMELTSIGDGVNLASRLEGVSKQYGCDIIISESTFDSCRGKVIARELDNIIVKGKTESVRIYDLIGLTSEKIDSHKIEIKDLYESARSMYLEGNFVEALEKFQEVIYIKPNDIASQLHIERCEHFIASPPENWDGVWKLTSK